MSDKIIGTLARLADDWKPTTEELYDALSNLELTVESRRGTVAKLREAHRAELAAASEEAARVANERFEMALEVPDYYSSRVSQFRQQARQKWYAATPPTQGLAEEEGSND